MFSIPMELLLSKVGRWQAVHFPENVSMWLDWFSGLDKILILKEVKFIQQFWYIWQAHADHLDLWHFEQEQCTELAMYCGCIIVHEYNSNIHLNLSYHDIILFPLQRTGMILVK